MADLPDLPFPSCRTAEILPGVAFFALFPSFRKQQREKLKIFDLEQLFEEQKELHNQVRAAFILCGTKRILDYYCTTVYCLSKKS